MSTALRIIRHLEEFRDMVWNEPPDKRDDRPRIDDCLKDGFQAYYDLGVIDNYLVSWITNSMVHVQFIMAADQQDYQLDLDFSFLSNSGQDINMIDAYDRAMRGI